MAFSLKGFIALLHNDTIKIHQVYLFEVVCWCNSVLKWSNSIISKKIYFDWQIQKDKWVRFWVPNPEQQMGLLRDGQTWNWHTIRPILPNLNLTLTSPNIRHHPPPNIRQGSPIWCSHFFAIWRSRFGAQYQPGASQMLQKKDLFCKGFI